MTARPPLVPPAPPCAEAPHGHAPRRRPAASAEAFERAAAIFRAAGDVPRLRLLERLGEGECCVTELATEASEALSTVSQRLRVLRAEGLITRRREGKHIYYALADAHVAEMIHNALEHAHEPGSGHAHVDADEPASGHAHEHEPAASRAHAHEHAASHAHEHAASHAHAHEHASGRAHAHESASGRAPSHSSAAGGPTAPRPATDDDHDGAATSDAGPGAPRPAPPATKPAKRRPTRKVQAP